MSKLRILLVDDEEELVSTMAERLELRGYECVAVLDGAEALVRIQKEKFDVAVVDVKMPGVSGLEVLKAIRLEHRELPVILLTGHGDDGDAREGMKSGARAYLLKPVSIEKLIEVAEQACRNEGE